MAETYEGLYVKFGANTAEFDNSVKGINKALTMLKKDYQNINKQLKMNPENTDLLNKKLKNLKEQSRLGALKIKELRKEQEALEKTNKKGTAQWNKLELEMSKVKGQMQVVERAAKSAKKQISDVGDPKSVYNLNKALENTEKELDIVQRKLKLDPKSIELITKESKLLGKQMKVCEDRVEALKKEQQSLGKEKIGTQEWKNLSYQIGEAEIKIKQTSNAMGNLKESTGKASKGISGVATLFKAGMWLEIARRGLDALGSAASYIWQQFKKNRAVYG